MKLILVACDDSEASLAAVWLAVEHARAFQVPVLLVHSMEGGPAVPRKDFERAEQNLERLKQRLLDKRIDCETMMSVRGLEAGEDLVRLAVEKQADEIIIGVRRRSKVGKLLFGSTAQYVILNAPCPVVTVA